MNNRPPLFLFSGDLIADRRYEYAQDFAERGDLAAAADLYAQAAERAPGFASAWYALGDVRERLGDNAAAIEAFAQARTTDPDDRMGAGVRLARLGAAPAEGAMSAAYVRSVFDQYAPDFDRALVKGLAYHGPELLCEAVATVCQQRRRDFGFRRALDLGCGTGLAGQLFGPKVESIGGVDLSPAMVALAEARGCYADVHVGDMLEHVRTRDDANYDLVIAADALVYLGDLEPLFRELSRVIEPGGLFAFSVEAHAGEGVVLGEKLRYAHARPYVEKTLAACGLRPLHVEPNSTRQEGGHAVPGLIVVAVRE